MDFLFQFIEAGKCFGEAIFASIFGWAILDPPTLKAGETNLGEPALVESFLLNFKKGLGMSEFPLLRLGAAIFDEIALSLAKLRFFLTGIGIENLGIRKSGRRILIARVNSDEEKLMLAGIFLFLTGREFMLGNPSGTCRKRKIKITTIPQDENCVNFISACLFGEGMTCNACPLWYICLVPMENRKCIASGRVSFEF